MSDGMGREFAYLSSHATNRYFIPNWGNHMKKYIKPIIAVRYVDIQGICAGSVIHIDPSNNATEDACSKGNATQLSIRDVWED